MGRTSLILALGLVLACRTEATQLIVVVDSDIADVQAVRIEVEGDDGRMQTNRFEIGAAPRTQLPFSFGVAPRKGSPAESQTPRIRVYAVERVDADGNDVDLVERRVQVGFVKNKTLHLLMYLAEACVGARTTECQEMGLVCDRGACVPESIDPRTLPEVDPREAITFDGGLGDAPSDVASDAGLDADGSVPLEAPVIVYPWNGVAAREVEMRWRTPEGTVSTRIDYGTSCDGSLPTCAPSIATGASVAVSSPTFTLPDAVSGRFFVRMAACRTADGLDCGEWSDTRYFDFGRTDLDLDDDGRDDVVIGAPGFGDNDAGRAWWYPSGFPGMATPMPIGAVTERTGGQFGARIAFVGDINADGSPDVAIGSAGRTAPTAVTGAVTVFITSGGTLAPSTSFERTPLAALAGIGDVDGDGFADFATSDGVTSSVHHGDDLAALDLATAGVTVITGIGDVDGDGLADFAVGIPADDFVVVFGGARDRSYPRLAEITAPVGNRTFGAMVAGVGDIVGDDHIPDFVIGAPDLDDNRDGRGVLYRVSGAVIGAGGIDVMEFRRGSTDYLRMATAAVQVDGTGWAYVLGGDADRDVEPQVWFDNGMGEGRRLPEPLEPGLGFGDSIAAGDYDGDGGIEILVALPLGGGMAQGEVRIFEPRPFPTDPTDLGTIPEDPSIGGGIEAAFGQLPTAPVSRLR